MKGYMQRSLKLKRSLKRAQKRSAKTKKINQKRPTMQKGNSASSPLNVWRFPAYLRHPEVAEDVELVWKVPGSGSRCTQYCVRPADHVVSWYEAAVADLGVTFDELVFTGMFFGFHDERYALLECYDRFYKSSNRIAKLNLVVLRSSILLRKW
jgi:hypothetical protein